MRTIVFCNISIFYGLLLLSPLVLLSNRCNVSASIQQDHDDGNTIMESTGIKETQDESSSSCSSQSDERTTTCHSSLEDDQRQQCGLYLAPSTIPHAGIGVFTNKELNVGDLVGYQDISIPIYDIYLHYLNVSRYDADNDIFWLLTNYVWSGHSMGMGYESTIGSNSGDDVSAFCPGLDAAVNCHLALVNVDRGTPQYDVGPLKRGKDPGVGSYSPYYNTPSVTKKYVPEGGELFKFYGNSWFETRPSMFNPETFPLKHHLQDAERITKRFVLELQPKVLLQTSKSTKDENVVKAASKEDAMMQDLWNIVSDFSYKSPMIYALPSTWQQAQNVARHTEGIRILHQPSATRSPQNLERTGRCIDNIKVGPSTLPQAAKGAFATRPIRKDTIVTGSPLIHIPHGEEILKVRDVIMDDTGMHHMLPDIVSKQLLYNYCFGHPKSSLLLCPYGSGVNYINHNQTKANVKIRWSPHGMLSQNDTWFDIDPRGPAMEEYSVQLSMDYVALRDIHPEEELFLDYGSEWEDAWESHVTHYRPPVEEEYVPASVWNFKKQKFPEEPLYTSEEQDLRQPYPPHVRLACHPNFLWEEWCQHNKHDKSTHCSTTKWEPDDVGIDCLILERYEQHEPTKNQNSSFVYDIQIFVDKEQRHEIWEKVSPASLKFEDMPYSTDIHLKEAFRHKLMIPNKMFPPKWKDLS